MTKLVVDGRTVQATSRAVSRPSVGRHAGVDHTCSSVVGTWFRCCGYLDPQSGEGERRDGRWRAALGSVSRNTLVNSGEALDSVSESAEAAGLSFEDVVDLGHRMIMGRPADAELREALLAELHAGKVSPAVAWGRLVGSPEFAQRVRHQREVIEATEPELSTEMIDVEDLREAKTIAQHNLAADGYFASRGRDAIEGMLAKPYADAHYTPELLTCFGHMVAGLQLLRGDVILDFAVGSGWTSWNFAQLGAQVICSDVSPAALSVVRERFQRWPLSPGRSAPRFLPFDGYRFDLPDSSVDKACCFDAFHHLINQPDVLVEFARVLKPGGLLGFDEPGRHHSKTSEAQFEMKEYGVVEGDIDLTEMAMMAGRAGLEFVAADVLTVRPIWADLDRFTDLVENRVPDAAMVQELSEQIQAKQLFILRKPGDVCRDSRDKLSLAATLKLEGVTTTVQDDGFLVKVGLFVVNIGAANWLPASTQVGGVAVGGRVQGSERWEGRASTNQPLTIGQGAQMQVDATFLVPATLTGQDLVVNLVSENVAWFETCGTPPVHVHLPE